MEDWLRPVVCGPLLFDNFIGRKRDVGGVVLAGLWRSGLLGGSLAGLAAKSVRETTDGHVSRIHRAFDRGGLALERREAGFCVGFPD
jgi:hypothetical protein